MKGINFKIRVRPDAEHPLRLFLTEWLDDICNDNFNLVKRFDDQVINEYYTVYFTSSEDELVTRLKGTPQNLEKYITMV